MLFGEIMRKSYCIITRILLRIFLFEDFICWLLLLWPTVCVYLIYINMSMWFFTRDTTKIRNICMRQYIFIYLQHSHTNIQMFILAMLSVAIIIFRNFSSSFFNYIFFIVCTYLYTYICKDLYFASLKN